VPVRWHRFAEDTFELGRQVISVEPGLTIGLYGPERSIVDAYRLRHLQDVELGREAVRRWLRRSGSGPAKLLRMAEHFPKAVAFLHGDLEVLQ